MADPRLRAIVIGYGRVGRPLAQALEQADIKVVAVGEHPDSPNVARAVEDGFLTLPVEHLEEDADFLFLTVPDRNIEVVALQLAESISLSRGKRSGEAERIQEGDVPPTVVHLSGGMGLKALNPLREAGFLRLAMHPMQTFPPEASADRFRGIHAGITADPDAVEVAELLCERLGMTPLQIPEERRSEYHLASVLASNFMPLMLELGAQKLESITGDRYQSLAALWPLMAGMTESLRTNLPEQAMTGPVARNDRETVRRHLESLPDDEANLYRTLSAALVKMAGTSDLLDDEQADEWLAFLRPENKSSGAGK